MPSVENISIALPPEMAAQVRRAVDEGEYASSSEVIGEALRDWERKRESREKGVLELRELWRQARADTRPGLDPDEVFDELEGKYEAMANSMGSAE